MFGKIKKIFVSIIGYSNYRKLLTMTFRKVYGINESIVCAVEIENVREFSIKGKDIFFGYYDLESLSIDKKKLLSHVIDCNVAIVGYFDTDTQEFHAVADTKAWNWQMGARLRWYVSGESILFNDFDGEKFISRIVGINGTEIKRFPFPMFDVDIEGAVAYFTDFTILHHLREGYGYSNKNVTFEDYYENNENGVFVADMNSGEVKMLVSINELKQMSHLDSMDRSYHYINHITINPTNKDIMFFHLWTNGHNMENRMVFVNHTGSIISVIKDFDRASHYDWKDDSHILVSVMTKGKTTYRLYNYHDCSYEDVKGISTDGHPTFIDDKFFITDTYPNHCAIQSVYVCNIEQKKYKNIFSIYHSPRKVGQYRCDLHPRVCGNLINIDSTAKKHRCQYLLRTTIDYKTFYSWNNKLLLDNIAQKDAPTYSSNLLKNVKSEYQFVTDRNYANPLKIIHLFLMSPTFRVNVYINWMQNCESKLKRKMISNYLQSKHSIVINPTSMIGKHFRADHPIGIVIGPTVKLGEHVKIYQNVTLGQKNGRFPRVGNYVVIYAGAVIIGDVEIGDHAVIGANAVVTKDVPAYATAVGVPARVILHNEND